MLLVIFLQLVVIVSIVRASRQGLENALPIFCFFLVLLPLESKLVIPELFDINTMRVSLVTLTILYLYRRERIDEGSLPLKGIIMLHIGWAVASTLYSLSISTSVKQLLSQILEYYVLYFVLVKTISKTETLHKMIFSMMMAMVYAASSRLWKSGLTGAYFEYFRHNSGLPITVDLIRSIQS
jgi:hypothetical protein